MDQLNAIHPDTPGYTDLRKNRVLFESRLAIALTTRSEQRRIQLFSQAAIWAVQNPCGIFNSKALEDGLTAIAAHHSMPQSATPTPGSVLHVFTRAYTSGGHTRMCERWINAAPQGQTHSVVLLSQGNRPVPTRLKEAAHQRHGSLTALTENLPLQQALALRTLASEYETIILHTHMHDIVPTLAFGTPEFTRPVILYNHADHLFWVGCAIADLTIDLRTLTNQISQKFRGLTNTTVMPLMVTPPSANPQTPYQKAELKVQLGFAPETNVIITIASPYKYAPANNLNFINTAEQLLAQSPNSVLLAIGPGKSNPDWNEAFLRSNGRINPIGMVPHTELDAYLGIADLALDSFPMSSLTAVLDIARYNVPCLTLASAANSYDAFEQAGIVCQTSDELISKSLHILSNPPTTTPLFSLLEKDSFPAGTTRHIQRVMKLLPSTHSVHKVTQDARPLPSEFEMAVAATLLKNSTTLRGQLINLARKLVFGYVRVLFPFGLTRGLHTRLNQYGIL